MQHSPTPAVGVALQLPGPDVLAAAPRLRRLRLVLDPRPLIRGSLQLTALPLPALEAVHACWGRCVARSEAYAVDDAAALTEELKAQGFAMTNSWEAEQLLEALCGPHYVRHPGCSAVLEWPDVDGLFQFSAAD